MITLGNAYAGENPVTPHGQIAVNDAARRWLADVLERWGLPDPVDRAGWVVDQLVEQGVRQVPAIPPLRGPGASREAQQEAKRLIDQALEEARKRRIADEGHGGRS